MRFVKILLWCALLTGCAESQESKMLDMIDQNMHRTSDAIKEENMLAVEAINQQLAASIAGGSIVGWAPKINLLQETADALHLQLHKIKDSVERMGDDHKSVSAFLRRQETMIGSYLNDYRTLVRRALTDSTVITTDWVQQKVLREVGAADSVFCERVNMAVPSKVIVTESLLGTRRNTALLSISRVEQALRLMERTLIEICGLYSGRSSCCCPWFMYWTEIDQERYSVGDTITVYAGRADIATWKNLEVHIGDTVLSKDEGGVVTYSWMAKGPPGAYTLPVQYEYEKPNGGKLSWTKNIQYVIEK